MNQEPEDQWIPPQDIDALAPKSASSWETWKASPSPVTLSGVLREVSPVIESAVSRHPGVSEGLMRSEAKRLAIQAVRSFDPAQGTSLSTHVFGHLRPLGRFAQKRVRAISVPREQGREVANFMKFNRDFLEEHGRDPHEDEIMDGLGLSAAKLKKVRDGSFYEFAEGQTENPIEVGEGESRLSRWTSFVYHGLTPQDKRIMDHRMGRNGLEELTPDQIAQKLNIDPSYVRKRAALISQRILEGVK